MRIGEFGFLLVIGYMASAGQERASQASLTVDAGHVVAGGGRIVHRTLNWAKPTNAYTRVRRHCAMPSMRERSSHVSNLGPISLCASW